MKKLDRAGNWKHCPTKKWPYKGLDDPKYIKDRDALLKENGNGWWWFQGYSNWKESLNKSKEKLLNSNQK